MAFVGSIKVLGNSPNWFSESILKSRTHMPPLRRCQTTLPNVVAAVADWTWTMRCDSPRAYKSGALLSAEMFPSSKQALQSISHLLSPFPSSRYGPDSLPI